MSAEPGRPDARADSQEHASTAKGPREVPSDPAATRWQRAKSLFNEAIALPALDRAALLDRSCVGDPALRAEVESLLAAAPAANVRTGGAAQAVASVTTADLPPISEHAGVTIGPYKLLEKIGEGGFGTVFLAEQQQPVRRRVALKIIKLGMDTRQVVARFEAERQALALMDHPSIARVLDAGATETGRPYFVMELVRGDPITRFCDARRMSIRERLLLFEQVCQAVHHAHMKGVIHRDIKPTNVLVTVIDGDTPLAKIIDFGIAKATSAALTDHTLVTGFRQLIGTLEYMSPEQADASALDVDTRSDVYTLGVLLYELLTGTTPLDGNRLRSAALAEVQRMIQEDEPLRPSLRVTVASARETTTSSGAAPEPVGVESALTGESAANADPAQSAATSPDRAAAHPSPVAASQRSRTASSSTVAAARRSDPAQLTRSLRGDLDWIVMKCLEKDRRRRYDSAVALAQDVRRHLSGEPVVAAPPSLSYRMRKAARRHRTAVLAGSSMFAALLISVITLGIFLDRERTHAKRVTDALAEREAALEAAQWAAYVAGLGHAQAALEAHDYPTAREQLELCPEHLRGWEWKFLNSHANAVRAAIRGVASWGTAARFVTGGSKIACSIGRGATYRDVIHDLDGNAMDVELDRHRHVGVDLVDPSGTYYLGRSIGQDGTVLRDQIGTFDGAAPCNLPLEFQQRTHHASSGEVEVRRNAQFSANGTTLLIWSGDTALLWDTANRRQIAELHHPEGEITIAALDSGAAHALTASSDGALHLWSCVGTTWGSATSLRLSLPPGCVAERLLFSPSSNCFVTWSRDGYLRRWGFDGSAMGAPLPTYGEFHSSFGFDAAGEYLFDISPRLMVWDISAMSRMYLGVEQPVHSSAEFQASQEVLLITRDEEFSVLMLDGRPTFAWPDYSPDGKWGGRLAVSPDGKHVLVEDNELDSILVAIVERWGAPVRLLADDPVRIALELDEMGLPRYRDDDRSTATTGAVVGTSPDGTREVVALPGARVLFREKATGRSLLHIPVRRAHEVHCVHFSKDGQRLVLWVSDTAAGLSREVGLQIWDIRGAAERRREAEHRWKLRLQAQPWVDQIGELESVEALREQIARQQDLAPFERLAALDVVDDRVLESRDVFERLRDRHLSRARVLAAAAIDTQLSPLIRRMVELQAEGWMPTSRELDNLAWDVVAHPGADSEQLDAALECAIEAAKLPETDGRVNACVLGIAQYRVGRYAEAIDTILDWQRTFGESLCSDVACLAMAHARLGQLDQAQSALELLRSHLTGETVAGSTEPFRMSCGDLASDRWLAEAEAVLREEEARRQPPTDPHPISPETSPEEKSP